ncbi:collagen alpha-1(III) chain-like [Macrobrachium rosenbergii]|uniref:collagen alpha-1(III) chain-like n=1 Tax=Macrobrachium rosenbergii TaxID=79674 RepID=UPI0034D6D064
MLLATHWTCHTTERTRPEDSPQEDTWSRRETRSLDLPHHREDTTAGKGERPAVGGCWPLTGPATPQRGPGHRRRPEEPGRTSDQQLGAAGRSSDLPQTEKTRPQEEPPPTPGETQRPVRKSDLQLGCCWPLTGPATPPRGPGQRRSRRRHLERRNGREGGATSSWGLLLDLPQSPEHQATPQEEANTWRNTGPGRPATSSWGLSRHRTCHTTWRPSQRRSCWLTPGETQRPGRRADQQLGGCWPLTGPATPPRGPGQRRSRRRHLERRNGQEGGVTSSWRSAGRSPDLPHNREGQATGTPRPAAGKGEQPAVQQLGAAGRSLTCHTTERTRPQEELPPTPG